jgi:metal-responsive CopG/Arc/MetJ family transcriptional regulator
MSVVKTAISLQENLFQQLDELAGDLNVSRSSLIAMALQEFIERHENKRLLDQLNAAYEDDPQREEGELSNAHRQSYRRIVETNW